MKLVKYMLFIVILVISIIFIIKLNELNIIQGEPVTIKFPYFSSLDGYQDGVKVWEAMILTLTSGVFLGFLIALFQIISQKTEIISLKSRVRRLRNEIDLLRNQTLEDDVALEDTINTEEDL